ncbi:MAG: hypothetical protein J5831_00965 [Bacteroidales bacterium]|nr:hypothetical protein [Bacteroidales bacterium]
MSKNLLFASRLLVLWIALLWASAAYAAEADSLYSFTWACGDQIRECTLHIDDGLLHYYRNDRDHMAYRYSSFNANDTHAPANFYSFIFSKHDREVIRDLARQLADTITSEKGRIEAALSFVQSLPYAKDQTSKGREEYLRYPVETLADGMGDCEDKSMLLGAVLGEWGMDYVLLLPPDHLALGVRCDSVEADRYFQFDGKKYYYLETTSRHWKIGQIPKQFAQAKFEVYPMKTTPTLMVKGVWFESAPTPMLLPADCSLKLELSNTGPGDVAGMQLEVLVVRIRNGREEGVAEFSFPLEDLPEGMVRTDEVRFKSRVPDHMALRMRLSGTDIDPQLMELDGLRQRRY